MKITKFLDHRNLDLYGNNSLCSSVEWNFIDGMVFLLQCTVFRVLAIRRMYWHLASRHIA